MNVQDMPIDQFSALSEAHQEHLMRHGTLPPEATPAPEPETPKAPTPEAQPAAPAPEAPAPAPEKKGDPEVPLRQTRAQLQEALAALEQHNKVLNDPKALRQHLASIDPAPPDFDLDPQAAIQHHIAPIAKQLADVKAELDQTKRQQAHQKYLGDLADLHGKDFHSMVQGFDAANPHLVHLDPEVRYFAAKGLQANVPPDPAAQQEAIQAAAEKLLAEKLGQGKAPVATLGNAPPIKGVDAEPTFDPDMKMSDFDKLSDAQIRAMGKNLGKK